MVRSTLIATLSSLVLLAAMGCASEGHDESSGASNDALSQAGRSLVGQYLDPQVPAGGLERISLESNGTYTAQLSANGQFAPESGKWSATSASGGKFQLHLRPTGHPARDYGVSKAGDGVALTTKNLTQDLIELHTCGGIAALKCPADCGGCSMEAMGNARTSAARARGSVRVRRPWRALVAAVADLCRQRDE